jgi:hypothetical protein
MQLSSRGPSGPARGSSRGKTMRDAVAAACQRDAPARFADRHRTPPPPPPSTSIRCHAYGEKGTEGRPRRAGARHPRQGDRSGRTSAVVSASARHAFGVGATPRSPSDYMGYCPHRREGHTRCGTRDGRTLSGGDASTRASSSSRAGVFESRLRRSLVGQGERNRTPRITPGRSRWSRG